ncbi:hypothetical protein ACT3CE_06590 [Marinifilum sp. RC60d5]|uniref:hypothetical protein n=1 Tax=Marinifilum sp. RC60d5 TaxID=3458414 RepID=UPI004036961B
MKLSVRCLLLLLLLIFVKVSVADAIFIPEKEKLHRLEVVHPGKEHNATEQLTLIENTNNEFYMDVPSVYCYDNVCKMDTLRIFWNEIGSYDRFELNKGIDLEKAEGEKFSKADYEKLHRILKNEKSAFRNLEISDILKSKNLHESDVDAMSGATAIDLEENEFVKGAVITCYTIWHWANNPIQDSIRRISGDALSADRLNSYLCKDEKRKLFAIQQIIRKGIYEKKTIDAINHLNLDKDRKLNKLRLSYLEKADAKIYFSSLVKLFKEGTATQKSLCLQSLRKTNYAFPVGFFEMFSQESLKLNTYQEVNLFLNLLEEKGAPSNVIIGNIISLLDKNILISRRAYWYLSNQKLNADQQNRLEAFRKENKDYL